MADAEMVFPDKKIYLKPLLLIQLAIAVIGGLVAAFTALLSVRAHCHSVTQDQEFEGQACEAWRLVKL